MAERRGIEGRGGHRVDYEVVDIDAGCVDMRFKVEGQAGEARRFGKTVWDRSVVWGMLKNPAYKGTAGFGKTRVEPLRPRLRAQRGYSLQPRRAVSVTDVPPDEWLLIPVPAIIEAELYAAVQEQLEENRRRSR